MADIAPPDGPPPLGGEGRRDQEEAHAELSVFSSSAYIYKLPAGGVTTLGHRAELWDVDNWLNWLSLRVLLRGDGCLVRLTDKETGEMFAEAPVPREGPLAAAVEPVVDSSRYFVLRLEDGAKHAFVGLGFRERAHASDFNAALVEWRRQVGRAKEAEAIAEEYEARAGDAPARDLSLHGSITISLKTDKAEVRGDRKTRLAPGGLAGGLEGLKAVLPPPPPPPAVRGGALVGGGGEAGGSGMGGQAAGDDDWGDDDGFGSFVSA